MIERRLTEIISQKLFSGKAIILMGPRQVGKTTILRALFGTRQDSIWLNGDETDIQKLFENISSTRLNAIFADKKIVVIDEAQRIEHIGLKLKLITDQLQHIQLIVTGSSAFDMANSVNEPLTGRKWEFKMLPVSFHEMVKHHGLIEEKRLLPHRLVYGYYPEIVMNTGQEKELLKQLTDSYLYKDILMLESVKKSDKLLKLLQALAFQVGSQVSANELGQLCGLDNKTINKYLELLEKVFVVFHLGSFSRNLRNELKFSRKYYFYDNGIRNALIANFNQPELRQDIGALWENFIISERQKYLIYNNRWANTWYWRTKEQKEIDYLEEEDGLISAFEFKWNPVSKVKQPGSFLTAYPNSVFQVIHRDNFESFILPA
ncbi:MAG: ATP-binding protein [Bacteroidota bacterium]|nr:ATP-binding protein [Bacteroidota bacterium]